MVEEPQRDVHGLVQPAPGAAASILPQEQGGTQRARRCVSHMEHQVQEDNARVRVLLSVPGPVVLLR